MMGSPPMPIHVDCPISSLGQLADRFVRQRAAAAYDADMARLMNLAGHNAHLALARRNDTRAIGANQARAASAQHGRDANHVDGGNALGDAHGQWQTRIDGFENRIGRVRRRNENKRRVSAGFAHGVCHRIEYGNTFVLAATLARRHSRDDARTVSNHLLRVETSLAPRKALHDHSGLTVNQNAHRAPPARRTAFSAPSFMPSAIVKLSPESRRIS